MADRSSERWKQLEEILVASWEMPAAEREPYWLRCAGGDAELLRELRELSAARERASNWAGSEAEDREPSARRIGPYKLDRLIGRGGMGAVYLAHRADGEFEQQVALKVVGLPFEIEPFRERFRRERQILAGLNHPNIARLLDGGTTDDGELYLAMEYIEGVAIDGYARNLNLPARIDLFGQVCGGVEYAHQRLVVHRDIKPSNILVNREGVPKLLDFGSAKLLADADVTGTGLRMITVSYASPEQLRGEPASTLSDVFSLGALLFELVTGRGIFGNDITSRLADIKQYRLAPDLPERLPGDLDRIVRKALTFDPAQRYSSAGQLAEDVRRYQSGEPVLAHPPSLAYRAEKFVRRHIIGTALAVLTILLMAAATLFSIWEARVARQQAQRAQAANQFLATVFQIPFVDSASSYDMTVRQLLELAEVRVQPVLGADPTIATDVDLVLGRGFESQQANSEASNLFQRALERARVAGDVPRQAAATSWLASVFYQSSKTPEAWSRALEALGLWKRARGRFTPAQAVEVLAISGQILRYIQPSNPIHREYLAEAVRLGRLYPKEVDSALRSASLEGLAESYLNAPGNPEPFYREAYPLIQEALTLDRADPSHGYLLLESLESWGRINRFLGNYEQDEAAQREAYQMTLKMLGPDHIETTHQRAVWAISLTEINKIQESYQESQAALVTTRRLFPVPGSFQLWTTTAAAAFSSCLTERFLECDALAREAIATLGPHPEPTDLRWYEARSYLALALAGQNRTAEALPLLRESLEFYRSRNRQGPLRAALEAAYAKAAEGR